jgi:hypothetical protein
MKRLVLFLTLGKLFVILQVNVIAQNQPSDSVVTCFLHISENFAEYYEVEGFVMNYTDPATNEKWHSPVIKPLQYDSSGYLVKVDLPARFYPPSKKLWCNAIGVDPRSPYDTVTFSYGGIVLDNIKLILKSDPMGADVFLIPNRVWTQKIKDSDWKKDISVLNEFRVNSNSTNTTAIIDQTVYVVIFKLEDRFEERIHYTRPEKVEKEQVISIKF